MSAHDLLDAMRRSVSAENHTIAPSLEAILIYVEQLAEELQCDPYPSFYLLGLLVHSPRFRDAVRTAGGDPDRGAQVIREDLEHCAGEGYGDPAATERAEILELAIDSARAEERTELRDDDLAAALVAQQHELARVDGDVAWTDARMRRPHLILAHIANVYDPSLDVNAEEVARATRPASSAAR